MAKKQQVDLLNTALTPTQHAVLAVFFFVVIAAILVSYLT